MKLKHTKSKVLIFLYLFPILLLVLTGCNNSTPIKENDYETIKKTSFLLNTVVTITVYDQAHEDILDECFTMIANFEKIYSRTNPNSELYALNHGTAPKSGNAYEISDDLADLFRYGLYYSELSQGSFDLSVAPVTKLWDFTSGSKRIPSDEDIANALPFIDYQSIHLNDDNTIRFEKEGMEIDFGAIAKGYIADRVKDHLLSNGVQSAMINLGGNVLSVGKKPDGSPYKIGVQKPFADRNETTAIMEISDYSVVSSGIYERFFTLDDVLYHHILNPKSGYPYENDLVSVTIISKDSVDGDGLSTTCFSLGLEKGMEFINSLEDIHGIFITKDYDLYYSDGFHDAITLLE